MPRTNRRNRGWFKEGIDARRHVLTLAERRRGGETWLHRYYLQDVSSPHYPCGVGQVDADLAELAQLAGDDDRPGQRRKHHRRN